MLNSAARLIFDHITPALIDLHWLPYPQRITFEFVLHFVGCNSVTVSPNQIIIIINYKGIIMYGTQTSRLPSSRATILETIFLLQSE